MPKLSEEQPSSQKLVVGPLEITLRRLLSDIAPGLFLLLIIYLHNPNDLALLGEGSTSKAIFYLLLAIPAGFIINLAGYFFFGGLIVRGLEGLMLRSDFICGRLVTICDWKEIRDYFGLEKAPPHWDYLLFRYNCQGSVYYLQVRA